MGLKKATCKDLLCPDRIGNPLGISNSRCQESYGNPLELLSNLSGRQMANFALRSWIVPPNAAHQARMCQLKAAQENQIAAKSL